MAGDFLRPLPLGESVFIVIDYYSRYYKVDIMKSTTAEKTVSSLREIFLRHGLPESITSDNGLQFLVEEFASYPQDVDIRHILVMPRCPQANGGVKRQHQSL